MNAIGRRIAGRLVPRRHYGVVRFGGIGLLLVATDAAKESWHWWFFPARLGLSVRSGVLEHDRALVPSSSLPPWAE